MAFALSTPVFQWLHRLDVVGEHELDGPAGPGDSFPQVQRGDVALNRG